MGRFRLVYTFQNRNSLLKGLKFSYINRNGAFIESKRLVRRKYAAEEVAKGVKTKALNVIKRHFKNLIPGVG